MLYDLEDDPYEQNNLAGDVAARSVLDDMDARLTSWMQKTGDSWDFNWTHPVEDKGRLYKHETFYTVEDYLAWAKQHPDLDGG